MLGPIRRRENDVPYSGCDRMQHICPRCRRPAATMYGQAEDLPRPMDDRSAQRHMSRDPAARSPVAASAAGKRAIVDRNRPLLSATVAAHQPYIGSPTPQCTCPKAEERLDRLCFSMVYRPPQALRGERSLLNDDRASHIDLPNLGHRTTRTPFGILPVGRPTMHAVNSCSAAARQEAREPGWMCGSRGAAAPRCSVAELTAPYRPGP